jgi:hypothetical protein
MAKNTVEIGVKVKDDGSVEKMALKSKNAAKGLDGLGKSANTADRNIKGAAQASANGTKNFSKMAQGAGGLVGVYATLAASAFAVSAAFQFLKSAMDFKNLLEGQKALGAVTGVAYKTISDSLVEATNGQLRYAEAAKAAAIGTASGLSPTQLSRLGSAAKNASVALGRDLGDSFDRLIRGVTKAEPELLDELGIILRLENATRKYGLEIGKSKDQLNEFERSQAVANEVLEQAERKFGAMEKLMDPTAHSLNQFAKAFDDIVNSLKVGIAGPLATIATFLSENILALTGAVSLFAGGLLKQVLPSMEAWKQSSIDTKNQTIRDQKAIALRLERTKKSYEKLKEARMNDADSAIKASKKITSGTTGGTKSGQGALDFLSGDSQSKRAQSAADKAIKHANKQIEDGVKKRTGLLKDMNKKQVDDLRKSYNIRAGIHKKGMDDFSFHLKRGKMSMKSFGLSARAMSATVKSAFASMASAAATAGRFIGKAFFWLSILSIAFEALKAVKDYFFPASEAAKKLGDENKKLSDKYSTLADEIERTNKALEDYSLMSIQERMVAKGNAAGSMDTVQLIKDVNRMATIDKSSEGYTDAYNNILALANEASALDTKFGSLVLALVDGTTITGEAKTSLIEYSNGLQQTRINLEQLPAKANAANAAMVKLIGTFKKPFGTELIAANRLLASGSQKAADDMLPEITKNERKAFLRQQHRGPDKIYSEMMSNIEAEKKIYNELLNTAKTSSALADNLEKKQQKMVKLLKDQVDAAAELNKKKNFRADNRRKTYKFKTTRKSFTRKHK